MRFKGFAVVTILVACPLAVSTFADDAKKGAPDVSKDEKNAFVTIAGKFAGLAKYCTGQNAFSDAKAQIDLGLELAPDSEVLKKLKADLKDTGKPPSIEWKKKGADRIASSHKEIADELAKLIKLCTKKGVLDHFEDRVEFLTSALGADGAIAGAVWFEPYRKWVTEQDKTKLDAGCENIDGKWLKPEQVADLDKKHSTFDSPWVFSDDIHEIKTNISYREAIQVYNHVHAYTQFFLRKFGDEWELKSNDQKLPIIVTAKQDDFKNEIKKRGLNPDDQRLNMEAVYYHGDPGPVFATKEPRSEGGAVFDAPLPEVMNVLQHEITHELCFEFSRFAHGSGGAHANKWAVEGFATYMQSWVRDKKGWHFVCPNPKNHEKGDGLDYWLAECKDDPTYPQQLEGFFAFSNDNFKAKDYNFGAGICYFLLDGQGGKYRKPMIQCLSLIHQNKATKQSMKECLKDYKLDDVDREYRSFISGIKLEEPANKN